MARRYHRRREAFVIAKIVILACNTKVVFVNVNLITQNFLNIFQYISNNMQRYTVYFIWKLLYMFRVVPPPIITSAKNCIYSI